MAYFTAKQYIKASKDWNNEYLCNSSLFAIKDLMKDNAVHENNTVCSLWAVYIIQFKQME